MKKILGLLFVTKLLIGFAMAQSTSIEDTFLSAPSAASLPNYVKAPVSVSSGIPDTHIPFFTLPTHNKSISINAGMSYHPNNSSRSNKASDLGLGWSTYGITNLVYQEVNPYTGVPDEYFYYSVLGRNGKFILSEDGSGNINVRKITNDKLRISANKVNDIYNFKIIDPMGTSFFFDIADRLSRLSPAPVKTFSTAYYLSRVVDVNNIEVLNYEYQEDAYTITSVYGTQHPVRSLKVKKIISPDFGEINLNYSFDVAKRKSYNDPFLLTSIELKNTAGRIVQKYGFQQSSMNFQYSKGYIPVPPTPCGYYEQQDKMLLNKFLKYNSDNSGYQTTEFTYNHPNTNFPDIWSDTYFPTKPCFENEPENPKYLAKGLLSQVKFPNGTVVKYEFELNQYFVNKNSDQYKTHFAPSHEIKDREAQYYEDLATLNFDTNQGNTILYNIPFNPDNSDGASYLQYWVEVDEYYENPIIGEGQDPYIGAEIMTYTTIPTGGKKYMPGYHTISITGTGGKGTIMIKRIRYKSLPLANYSTGKGVRIKKIEYYDGNTLIPSQTKNYEYQMFSDPTQPSGILNENYNVSVVYKNVKETIGTGGGYTRYYFKTLADFPQNLNSEGALKSQSEIDYYDVLMNGIIEKTEIYKNDHTLLSKENHAYEYHQTGVGLNKKSMIKKHFLTVSTYTGSDSITVNSESTIDTRDLNVVYKKNTESDGTITESNIVYPWGVSPVDPRLWNANITTVPLSVETKRNG
ncbi:hypothetical protein, partial [uncultured Chryseobacterium sp.]|uniref:hypothetical protein n=1 Tax=uncultured Chryseobacterium sp. TaxID=259322 RepID=UPI002632958E